MMATPIVLYNLMERTDEERRVFFGLWPQCIGIGIGPMEESMLDDFAVTEAPNVAQQGASLPGMTPVFYKFRRDDGLWYVYLAMVPARTPKRNDLCT